MMNAYAVTAETSKDTKADIIQFPLSLRANSKPAKAVLNAKPYEPVEPIKDVADIAAAKEYLLAKAPAPEHYRDYMMFVININNAVRISDLFSLRIGDVLSDNGTIADQVYIRESKTKKTRYIFFGPSSKEAISMYLESLPEFRLDDYLFSNYKRYKLGAESKPISRQYAWKVLSEMGHKISEGRDETLHLGTHSMRKTFGYQKIKQNPGDQMIVAQVSEMYNHKNMNTTYRYLGIDTEEKRALCVTNEL